MHFLLDEEDYIKEINELIENKFFEEDLSLKLNLNDFTKRYFRIFNNIAFDVKTEKIFLT